MAKRGGSAGRNKWDAYYSKLDKPMMKLARETEMSALQKDVLADMLAAYDLGAQYSRYNSLNEALDRNYEIFDDTKNLSFNEMIAFEAGMKGTGRKFEFVTAWRVGNVPKNGRSTNFTDQKLEPGLSVMRASNGMRTQDPVSAMFIMSKGRPIVYVSGFVHPYRKGGDGEPLLLQTRVLRH